MYARLISLGLVGLLMLLGPLVGGASSSATRLQPLDREQDCDEWVPEELATPADQDSPVTLRVLIVLDGINKKDASEVASFASKSYEQLDITLETTGFKRVAFPHSGEGPGGNPEMDGYVFMDEMKRVMGGERPPNVDVVYGITNKILYFVQGGQKVYGLSGLADCIGGIRYDNRSFALGAGTREDRSADQAGHTMAHELGHILGAHHHYANCVEGPAPSLCTVMFNADLSFLGAGNFNSASFGTLESAVIKGHAGRYLAP